MKSQSASHPSRKSEIIRIKRPSSVDPRQPNISYRIPSVSGYHSRCSSPANEMHAQDYFDHHPSQVKISLLYPDNRKQMPSTMKPIAIRPKTQINKKFMQKTIGCKQNIPIAEYRSQIASPRSQAVVQPSQSIISQRERLETEMSFMGKTRLTKRLAQIVPHRIDQPYFMAGSCAKLSKRSIHEPSNRSPSKSKTTTSKLSDVTSEFEVDEEEFERLRLRADSANSRNSSTGERRSTQRQRLNTPTHEDGEKYTGQRDINSRPNAAAGNAMQDGEGENVKDDEKQSVGGEDASNIRSRGSKIITVGNFAESEDSSISLTDGIDFATLDPSELCIYSKKQKRAFEGMFNDIDFDKNGKVTFNELMHRMFSNVSKKDAKLLMQIFDINKDKTIDRREFIVICALNDRLCGYKTESKNDSLRLDLGRLSKLLVRYKELFSLLDQDDNEKIHVDEIMLIMTTAMGKEIGMNEYIARSIIDAVDRDKYGYIDFVSFLSYIPFFLKLYKSMMDSNDIELRELEEARHMIRSKIRRSRGGSSKK